MRYRLRFLKRAGWRGRTRKLARLAVAVAVASGPAMALVPRTAALAAEAHVLAYNVPPLCGGAPNCWYPANFHINAGDKVSWYMGSGTHGLQQLNSASPWPSNCPKKDYPTCSFSQRGTYNFQCRVHGAAMSGSVMVDIGPPPQPQSRPAPPGQQGAPQQGGPPQAANPSPNGGAQALLPSAPSSASPSSDPSGGTSAANNNQTNSGGGGSRTPLIIGVVVLLAIAGAAAYFIRARQTAGRSP